MNTGPVLEATAILLTNSVWRQRVVEKIVPLSVDHYELRRSFQFEIPPDLVKTKDQDLDVLLPVCWLPKGALLELDVSDENGVPLHVLERRSIAGVMSEILDAWKSDISELGNVGLSRERLESVCVASLDLWETARTRALSRGLTDVDALCGYLNELQRFRVTPSDVATAFSDGKGLARRIYDLIGRDSTQQDYESSFAVGAILAPYLVPSPGSKAELLKVLVDHQAAVAQALEVAKDSEKALGWVSLAAEVGVSWNLMARGRVPIGEPFLVKVREVRDSGDRQPRVFVHRADLSAARSYHLHVRAPDQAVWIPHPPEATAASGDSVGVFDVFENTELTSELFTTYTSLDPRPDWVDIRITFRLRWQSMLGYWYAIALVLAALVGAFTQPVDPQLAAVLTIPTTIVSAYLLAQDAPLTARYLHRWRLGLVVMSVILWLVAGYKSIGCPWSALPVVDC